MRVLRSNRGLGSLVVAVLIVLALGVGTVYAAIPNGSGKYSACLVKNTGAVRLINFPKVSTCQAGEKLISWNAKGPQGPAGPAGAQGAQGPQGPTGPSGSSNWGDIANKPADLADGQIGWGEVANKPAGFADGEDEGDGYASSVVTSGNGATVVPANSWVLVYFAYDIGVDIEPTFIPTNADATIYIQESAVRRQASGGLVHWYRLRNETGTAQPFKVRVRVFSQGIATAALNKAVKSIKVGVTRKGPRS